MKSFYSESELANLGLKLYGKNVLISRNTQIYSPDKISLGDNVRIDDYCILSGDIILGSNIHIAPYCALYGQGGILMEDYSGLSSRCVIYSASDDYSGDFLAGPVHPQYALNVNYGLVHIKRFVTIGTNSSVMPNVTIEEGSVVGEMSLVNKSLDAWGIYIGIPVKKIKDRSKGLLKFIEK
jgi:acetyltransferase-like isoleucine patch superfamily enzyme